MTALDVDFTYEKATAITPHDSNLLAETILAFYVGAAGDVRIQSIHGEDVVLAGCQIGTIYPIACKQVFATNTTATDIFGLR